MIERMLDGREVKLEEDFLKTEKLIWNLQTRLFYTGMWIDEYYNYCYENWNTAH